MKPSAFARTRTRGVAPYPVSVQEMKTHAGVTSLSYQGSAWGDGDWEVMNDVVTPRFRPGGKIVMNPMNSLFRSQTCGSGGYTITQISGGGAGDKWVGNGNSLRAILANPIGNEGMICKPALEGTWGNPRCQMAIAEAATKAQRVPSDANVLVTLAEMRQTMRMVPDLLSSWTTFFRRLTTRRDWGAQLRARGVKANTSQTITDLANQVNNNYLMARFGLRPLVMDTQGVLKSIEKQYSIFLQQLHTSRGAVEYSETATSAGTAAYGILRTPWASSSTHNVSVRAMQLWAAKIDLLKDVGVSYAQIPEAAIDLVSYSFVLNWVVNINDYFSAMGNSLSPTMESRGACMMASREATTVVTTTAPSYVSMPTVYRLDAGPEGTAVVTMRSKARTVGLPTYGLTVRARPLRWMDDLRLLDAVALLKNVTRTHESNLNSHAVLKAAQLRSKL